MTGTVTRSKPSSRDDLISLLPLTAFGDLRTAELTPQFQGSFEYTVTNTELNTNTITNGGTITQANAMAVLGTSTTTASTAKFQSKRHAKYKAGLGGLSRFTTLFTKGVATTEQYVGIMDATGSSAAFKNGLAIGFDGETFGFHRFSNDAKTSINLADWDDPLNGSGSSGVDVDLTKLNVWEIRYQYLGAGKIELCIEDRAGRFVVVHEIQYANKNILPSTQNPNYHHTMWVNNAGTTDDIVIKSSSYAYFVEGMTRYFEMHQPQFSSQVREKTTVTTEVAIFTIRNKTTYASKTNFIDIVLEVVGVSIEASSANNLGQARLVRDATLGGTPSFSDISTTDSVVEIDTAGTTVTGGKELLFTQLAGKNDRESENVTDYEIILAPGETITVAGSSANSATIDAGLLWKELF